MDRPPDARGLSRLRSTVDIVTSFVMVVAAAVVVWGTLRPPINFAPPRSEARLNIPSEPVTIEAAAVKGKPSARVAVIEFSEFQCPACARFALDTLPELRKDYLDPGKVLLVFRHFPLQELHPLAFGAARAAECAERVGRFWEMHDLLFKDQAHLDESHLIARSKSIGLDQTQFLDCLHTGTGGRIRGDVELARRLAVSGTPAFLIGLTDGSAGLVKVTHTLIGAQPAGSFRRIFDELLRQGE
jgi:protein-disulfide isomerase